ncbi:hypothetical protein DL770_000697 [Monosporascus sp. CRB-9-2]|nr:hypothetical protein DL770_000697 [Monosporascus sp. CRB-9-2]
MSNSAPIYQPLPVEGEYIRLFELLPRSPGTFPDLIGNLRTWCIGQQAADSRPNYIAISYTWRNDVAEQKWSAEGPRPIILCNGIVMEITPNIFDALRCLRRPDVPVSLWVDLLCINQSDNQERSRQVSLMGLIFQRSAETVIWLGDPHVVNHDVTACVERTWGMDQEADETALAAYQRAFEAFERGEQSDVIHIDSHITQFGHHPLCQDIVGIFALIYQISRGVLPCRIRFYESGPIITEKQFRWSHSLRKALWEMLDSSWVRRFR